MSYKEFDAEYLIKKKLERLKYEALDPKDQTANNKPCATRQYFNDCIEELAENHQDLNKRLCVQVDGHTNQAVRQYYYKP